jgi:hypothetical protein
MTVNAIRSALLASSHAPPCQFRRSRVKKIRVTGSVIGYRLVVETERYVSELTHDQSDHYSRKSDNEHTCEYDLVSEYYTFNNYYFLIVCELSHIILYLILLVLIR